MDERNDLETLYQQAQAALAAKRDEEAGRLLKRILVLDEDYEDAAQLLSELVTRQRRRWYQDRRLWAVLGGVAIILFVFSFKETLLGLLPTSQPVETPLPTLATLAASPTELPTPTFTPPPTAVPLSWRRLYSGSLFSRDGISDIVFDPSDPDVIYVSMNTAGIYKSIDGGVSWRPAHRGLDHVAIVMLTIDPENPQVLYAGTTFGGIYKTIDGGDHWQTANEGMDLSLRMKYQIFIDLRNPDHLYCGGGPRLYESFDKGESWSEITLSACPNGFTSIGLHPTEPTLMYGIVYGDDQCPGGVYLSSDGGWTWSFSELDPDTQVNPSSGFRISPSGNALYISATSEMYGDRLYVSTDGGDSWNRLGLNDACTFLTFHPEDEAVAYCATRHNDLLLKTSDMGQTWQELIRPDAGVVRQLSFGPQGAGTLFLGGDGFFVSTDDASTWVERSDGLGSGSLELVLDPTNPSTFYVQDGFQHLFRSNDGGLNWSLVIDEGFRLAFNADKSTLYRLAEWEGAGLLMMSRDRGETWTHIEIPVSRLRGLDTNPYQAGILYVFSTGQFPHLYVSIDHGEIWQATSGFGGVNDPVLFFDHDQGQVVYAVHEENAISRSEDGGWNWMACGDTRTSHTDFANRLVIDPRDSNQLLLATWGRGVLLSQDGCQSWRTSNQDLGNLFVNAVAMDPTKPDTIYAGTDGGAYVSFDGGEQWSPINEGLLGALVVYSIAVDPINPANVYAATPYGIFKLEGR
jgi:photosystem II stability/assembly factor-like uncharacterized protein